MIKADNIINEVAKDNKRVILFHSASGKDSIALLHLLHDKFEEIICVYMYLVKDLYHINRYISYATQKYKNVKFVQIPHFGLYSYIKHGYMGCIQNKKQKQYTLSELSEIVREKYNVDWVCMGFKKSDSMNRRLMLNTYREGSINDTNKKFYPLSDYKNRDVIKYIEDNNLIKPERYGKGQSAGTNISDISYLLFLKNNYPQDLEKVIEQFPMVERILYEYEYKKENTAE